MITKEYIYIGVVVVLTIVIITILWKVVKAIEVYYSKKHILKRKQFIEMVKDADQYRKMVNNTFPDSYKPGVFDRGTRVNLDKAKKESQDSLRLKSLFVTYFDGCYGFDPIPDVSSTFQMGVTKLEYNDRTGTLVVHLRRPGLLIGKAGCIIDTLKEYLGCKIDIREIIKL